MKKCGILRIFDEILARKPWKMVKIQKFLRIMFIHVKWHQKNYCSDDSDEEPWKSGIYPYP